MPETYFAEQSHHFGNQDAMIGPIKLFVMF